MTVFCRIGALEFEWDSAKAKTNKRKHKLSFEGGATVFQDHEALLLDDPDLFEDGVRQELLGLSAGSGMLVVVHIEREFRLRIVSVRPATKGEKKLYEKGKS